MSETLIAIIMCVLGGIVASVISYDVGKYNKEQECAVFGKLAVRAPGRNETIVYQCSLERGQP